MAARAILSKSSLAFVVISPPITTTLDFTSVSQATRLDLSCARQASRTASEMVSATLSGCPSPTDSEEKMYRLSITLPKKTHDCRGSLTTYAEQPALAPARAAHQVGEITARKATKYRVFFCLVS